MGIGFDRNGFLTIMVVYLNQPFLYTSWWLTNEVSIIENVEMGSTFKPPNQKKYIWLYSPIVRMICTQKRVVVTLLLPCQIMISFALSSEAHTVGGGYANSSPPLYHWNLWFFRPPIGALPPPHTFERTNIQGPMFAALYQTNVKMAEVTNQTFCWFSNNPPRKDHGRS